MGDLLIMSDTERQFKAYFEMVRLNKIKLTQVAEQMGYSYSQVKKRYRRYKRDGDAGLVHAARGRSSNNRNTQRALIIKLYQERYEGFGPTLASEKLLEEYGIAVSDETLRIWLLREGLWCKVRKRSPYRKRRERRESFGELVQIDGSIHDWFGTGKKTCLFNMIDDATSTSLTYMAHEETTEGIFRLLWRWIKMYGIPLAVYVDLKTVYIGPKELSHFQKVCQKLGIRVIKARSPQAKGRVERRHAVYQDRFVKELKLRDIRTIQAANDLLQASFDEHINNKFSITAASERDAHRDAKELDLNQIICWEYERQVQNDWTFSFKNKCYQIQRTHAKSVKPKAYIKVRLHLDGNMSVWHGEQTLQVEITIRQPANKVKQKQINLTAMTPSQAGKIGKQNSPWRKYNPDGFFGKHRNQPLKLDQETRL